MALTEYALNRSTWTNCGAADDCTAQTKGEGVIAFVTGTVAPSDAVAGGLLIGVSPGLTRGATVQRAGSTLYARIASGVPSLVVER